MTTLIEFKMVLDFGVLILDLEFVFWILLFWISHFVLVLRCFNL